MAIVTVRIPPSSGTGEDIIVELTSADNLLEDLPGLIDKVVSERKLPVFIAGFGSIENSTVRKFTGVSSNTKFIPDPAPYEKALDYEPDFFKGGHVIIPFKLSWFMTVLEKSGCDWDWLIGDTANPPRFHESLGHFINRLFEVELVPETAPKIEAALERIFATARQIVMTEAAVSAAEPSTLS